MAQKRLEALGYMEWEKIDVNNPEHFRKLVIWLEDRKIRYYNIEDRKDLRNFKSENWLRTFEKYCKDLRCPYEGNIQHQLEWLIGQAIWLDTGKNCQEYSGYKSALSNLDIESVDFKRGVYSIAKVLQIPEHPNHLITLEACSRIVQSRLNPECLKFPDSKILKGKPFPVMDYAPGFNLNTPNIENGVKILALLYIQDLRDLQTKINEIIVALQKVTANPKTDTNLGKVGK